jgi:hypothetical protein
VKKKQSFRNRSQGPASRPLCPAAPGGGASPALSSVAAGCGEEGVTGVCVGRGRRGGGSGSE